MKMEGKASGSFLNHSARPAPPRVMPAKAPRGASRGIHDFFAAPGSSAFVTLTEKSWMPAVAGMTGFWAATGTH